MNKEEKVKLVAGMLAEGKTAAQVTDHINNETDWGVSGKTIEGYITDAKKLNLDTNDAAKGKEVNLDEDAGNSAPDVEDLKEGGDQGSDAEDAPEDENENQGVTAAPGPQDSVFVPASTDERKGLIQLTENTLQIIYPLQDGESSTEYENRIVKTCNLKLDSESQTVREKYPFIEKSFLKQMPERAAAKEAGGSLEELGQKKVSKKDLREAEKQAKKDKKASKKDKKARRDNVNKYSNEDYKEPVQPGQKEFEALDAENLEAVKGQVQNLVDALDDAINHRREYDANVSVSRLVAAKRTLLGLNKSFI